jgi:hypothetical protein
MEISLACVYEKSTRILDEITTLESIFQYFPDSSDVLQTIANQYNET